MPAASGTQARRVRRRIAGLSRDSFDESSSEGDREEKDDSGVSGEVASSRSVGTPSRSPEVTATDHRNARRTTPLPWLDDPLIPPPPGRQRPTEQLHKDIANREKYVPPPQPTTNSVTNAGTVEYGEWGAVQNWRPRGGDSSRRSASTPAQPTASRTAQGGNNRGMNGRLVLSSGHDMPGSANFVS